MLKGMFSKPENAKLYWKNSCINVPRSELVRWALWRLYPYSWVRCEFQTSYQFASPSSPQYHRTDRSWYRYPGIRPYPCLYCAGGVIGGKIASELGQHAGKWADRCTGDHGYQYKTYLVMPKIAAALLVLPMLVVIAMVLGIYGGRVAGAASGILSVDTYDQGLLLNFTPAHNVTSALIKVLYLLFIISSVPAYYGYYVKGGSLEIGRSSTKSVVVSCVTWSCWQIMYWQPCFSKFNLWSSLKISGRVLATKWCLMGVSHLMETGKANLIIGSSGSGKTVLQKCLVGLIEPDEGEIIYDGKILPTCLTKRKLLRQQIRMLFQGSALFDSMTVEDNIKFPLTCSRMMVYQKIKQGEWSAGAGEPGRSNKIPGRNKRRYEKRVAIAWAVVLNPEISFLVMNLTLDLIRRLPLIDKLILEITKEYNMTTIKYAWHEQCYGDRWEHSLHGEWKKRMVGYQ